LIITSFLGCFACKNITCHKTFDPKAKEHWWTEESLAVNMRPAAAGRNQQPNLRLPWGLDFNPHTHPIPTEKPVGIPTESPYPQNPEILHTYIPHPASFC